MRLLAPSLVISFGLQQAHDLLFNFLKQKNWNNFKVNKISLELIPFILFEYSIKSTGNKGKFALNTNSLEPEPELVDFLSETEKINEFPKDTKFKVINSVVSKTKAKNKFIKLLSEELKINKNEIESVYLEEMFFPVWKINFQLAEKSYDLIISAVNGEILGDDEIPERELSWSETTNELISELKNPNAWAKYSEAFFKDAKQPLNINKTKNSKLSKNSVKKPINNSIKKNQKKLIRKKKLIHKLKRDDLIILVLLILFFIFIYLAFSAI